MKVMVPFNAEDAKVLSQKKKVRRVTYEFLAKEHQERFRKTFQYFGGVVGLIKIFDKVVDASWTPEDLSVYCPLEKGDYVIEFEVEKEELELIDLELLMDSLAFSEDLDPKSVSATEESSTVICIWGSMNLENSTRVLRLNAKRELVPSSLPEVNREKFNSLKLGGSQNEQPKRKSNRKKNTRSGNRSGNN